MGWECGLGMNDVMEQWIGVACRNRNGEWIASWTNAMSATQDSV